VELARQSAGAGLTEAEPEEAVLSLAVKRTKCVCERASCVRGEASRSGSILLAEAV
jgi:hypothetical protein